MTLGVRADATSSFGDVPFYMRPFVALRGAPIMRYQGEQVAQVEAELRWQFWKRFSLVGFAGAGAAWNDFDRLENQVTLVTGGADSGTRWRGNTGCTWVWILPSVPTPRLYTFSSAAPGRDRDWKRVEGAGCWG